MDFSRLIFRVLLVFFVLFAPFAVGLYSAHHENVLYRLVYGTYDQVRLVQRELPNIMKTTPIHFLRPARYEGDGVTVNTFPPDTGDLLLLSGFFKDHNAVRLIERDGTVVHEWNVSLFDTVGDASFCRNPPGTEWNAIPHGTLIEPDGSIVFSFESCGMVKLDACSKTIWAQHELITHHSPNFMSDGNIVIAGGRFVDGDLNPPPWPFDDDYWEDLIYVFSPDGKLLREKALTQLFLENDFAPILTANGEFKTWINGEFHLNEVEELSPELAPAFPMFEAGDLMLSIRNRNLIMVVDKTMSKIKWYHIGPWVRQHDPDFEPDGTITLFDNNTDETDLGNRGVGSRIYQIDPATNETHVLYGGTAEQHFYSRERATHQIQPDGSILVAEAQGGRVFQVDRSGKLLWEYVNRYDDTHVTWMHDASVIPRNFLADADLSCVK